MEGKADDVRRKLTGMNFNHEIGEAYTLGSTTVLVASARGDSTLASTFAEQHVGGLKNGRLRLDLAESYGRKEREAKSEHSRRS